MAGGPAHHYLVGVDAAVDSPRGLEVLQHALLEWAGQAVHSDEILEVLHAAVVERASGVHALDDGCDVPKHHGVHQSCGGAATHSASEAIASPSAPGAPQITQPWMGLRGSGGRTGELAGELEASTSGHQRQGEQVAIRRWGQLVLLSDLLLRS